MAYDPIAALQALSYTEREAAFLYLVAMHSGYFLRRQFDYFIDRNKGSIVSRFLSKARTAGHIEVLDYKQGWYVYHLCSRVIYRLCGDAKSQLRRRKADARVRTHLMALDYVLGNEDEHYLTTEAERVHFFEDVRGLDSGFFSSGDRGLYALLKVAPISLEDRERPARSRVRFVFIDEGLVDESKFERYLDEAELLLRAVGNFEVVYLATSEFVFASAKRAFWARFSPATSRSQGLFDVSPPISSHTSGSSIRAAFTTVLFRHSYPAIEHRRGWGSGRVRSVSDSIRSN